MGYWRDRMSGGYADKDTPSDFSKKDIKAGEKVEAEHTSDKHLQKEIAMDHLREQKNRGNKPNYYRMLSLAET